MANGSAGKGCGGPGGGGGGLGDILSMALLQTGVDSLAPTQISMDSNSILNAAANTLDSSLLSTDIGVLTEGLFSTLAMAKGNTVSNKKSCTTNNTSGHATPVTGILAVSKDQDVATPSSLVATHTTLVSSVHTSPPSSVQHTSPPVEVVTPAHLPLTLLPEPPSESEMKTAQLLKAELHNSCMDNDIDLDELLMGDDSCMDDMSLLNVPVDPLQASTSSELFHPLTNSTAPNVTGTNTTPTSVIGVNTQPSLIGVNTGLSGAGLNTPPIVISTRDTLSNNLSSLFTMASTSYLGNLAHLSNSTPTISSNTTSSTIAKETTSALPVVATTHIVSDTTSSVGKAFTSISSTKLHSTSYIATTTTTPPVLPKTSPTPTPSVSLFITPTTTALSGPPKKQVIPSTKLDIAAILREVTKMTPASISASTSSLTNTVSVTVVPSAAVQNALRGGVKTQRVLALTGSLSAKTQLALQRYIHKYVRNTRMVKPETQLSLAVLFTHVHCSHKQL